MTSPPVDILALVNSLESKRARSQQVLRWVALDQQLPAEVARRLGIPQEAADILLFRSAVDPNTFEGTDADERKASHLLSRALSDAIPPTQNAAARSAWNQIQALRSYRKEVLEEQERRLRDYENSPAALWHERLRQLLILLVIAASIFFYWRQHH